MTVAQQVGGACILVGFAVLAFIAAEIQREYRWQRMRWRTGRRETEPRRLPFWLEVLAWFGQ